MKILPWMISSLALFEALSCSSADVKFLVPFNYPGSPFSEVAMEKVFNTNIYQICSFFLFF